jgi:hypothetical protein
MDKKIRIGTGAGYSGDRIEPAEDLARLGNLDYLIFECLAERTIASAQMRKLEDFEKGYDPMLEERMRRVLASCDKDETRIITNMGAANPRAAGKKVLELLMDLELEHLKVGIVLGDDILDKLKSSGFSNLKENEEIAKIQDQIISANVYLGASPIIGALSKGADIIITGRTCDTSLFLAPMMFEFAIKENDWERIGKGIAIGHLLECGGQVTGGYFTDPGHKDVKGLANLGFPMVEISENLDAVITKLPDTDGEVSLRTCKEQLLYEVHDPASYITADGISDFTKINLEELGKDRVKITGGGGRNRPEELKVSMGYRNGFTGEAQISYGGEKAMSRAQLAAQILMMRFGALNLEFDGLRIDFMGVGSLWPKGSTSPIPNEIRLRVVGRAYTEKNAEKLCNEVEALYTNGPAGGGGVTRKVEENIAITSVFIPRDEVNPKFEILGEKNG